MEKLMMRRQALYEVEQKALEVMLTEEEEEKLRKKREERRTQQGWSSYRCFRWEGSHHPALIKG